MYKFAKGLGGGDLGVSKNIETQLGWLRLGERGGGVPAPITLNLLMMMT